MGPQPDDDDFVPYGSAGDEILQGILSPASAQSLVPTPPDTPAQSGAGQTTPVTGSLATSPSQATPKNSDMLQGQPSGYDASGKPIYVTDLLGGRDTTVPGSVRPLMRRGSNIPPSTRGILPDGTYSPGSASLSSAAAMPSLPATASTVAPPAQQKLAQDQAALNNYQQTGSGVSQIKRPWLRALATVGDIGLTAVNPNIERVTPGTMGNNQRLQENKESQIANDQQQQQSAANLADTQSQTGYRNAQQRQADSKANYYNPTPLTPEQAASIGSPTLAGTPMDTRDFSRLQEAYQKAQATRDTHTGGQSKTLSQQDATAIGMPSLSGITMSNDEYQKTLQQYQRNQQSGANNANTNRTRVTTTGMNNRTSTGNNQRTTQTSAANNQRTTQTSAANNGRTNQTRTAVQGMKDANFGAGNQGGNQDTVTVQMPDGSIKTGPAANLPALQKRYGGKLRVVQQPSSAATTGSR